MAFQLLNDIMNLDWYQRIIASLLSFAASLFCFFYLLILTPMAVLHLRKFILMSMFSLIFFFNGFLFLIGLGWLKNIFNNKMYAIPCCTLSSAVILTLYAATFLQSTLLTIAGLVIQIISSLWLVKNVIPTIKPNLFSFSTMSLFNFKDLWPRKQSTESYV